MKDTFDVFISYSREDTDKVVPWVKKLRDGGLRIFFDTEAIFVGNFRDKIASALESCRIVIFMASPSSFSSNFVPKELTLAEDYEKPILPVFLEFATVPRECALILAGVQRINAYQMPENKVWQKILNALDNLGLEWKAPQPPAVHSPSAAAPPARRPKPDDRILDLAGIDPPRFVETHACPPPKRSSFRIKLPWTLPAMQTSLWAAGGLTLGVVVLWLMGGWPVPKVPKITGTPAVVTHEVVLEKKVEAPVAKAIPVKVPETLPQAAERIAKEYYANPGPAQLTLLADNVNYLGHQSWTKAQIAKDLESYSRIWPRQSLTVLNHLRTSEPHPDSLECEELVHFEIGNEAVESTGNFVGLVTVGVQDDEPRIIAVEEKSGSRADTVLTYLPDGQERRAVELVRSDVMAGNSNSNMSAEEIASHYLAQNVGFYETSLTRTQIVQETQDYQNHWPNRMQRINEGPTVISGLGTDTVTVKVVLQFRASRANGGSVNSGVAETQYDIHFSRDGTALIKNVRKTNRHKAPVEP